MKKLLLTIFTGFIFTMGYSQTVVGTWLGTLDVGVKLRLVFNITTNEQQKLAATMDSPDQGVKGIPASSVFYKNDSIVVEIKTINGNYKGRFINDTTLEGTWQQSAASFALLLQKVNAIPAANRPQMPRPPFPYHTEEVAFDNASKTVHLAGTFTYPATGGPFATAILISGSGQQDRDETIAEHKPFAVIADHLTREGIAVLRLDDRGTGLSTGDFENATSEDFAQDIEAAIQYISKHSKADKNNVGLIGHSEGGLIASIIASRNKHINFIVLLAGPGTQGTVLLADQGEAILNSSGVSTDASIAYKPLYTQAINAAIQAKDTTIAFQTVLAAYHKWKKETPENIRTQLGITTDEVAENMLRSLVTEFRKPWMKFFLTADPAEYLQKINAKVLALNGEKDLQVLPQQNLEGIKTALQKSKSPLYEVKELKGLNHLFQTCKACTIAEYGMLEETFSPVALQTITQWLQKNVIGK